MAGLLPSQGLLVDVDSGRRAPGEDLPAWSRTSVVLPAYQERSRLPVVLTALRTLPFARLVVDDGSTDGTWRAAIPLLRPGDVALRLTDNQGKAVALWHGLRYVETP